MKPDPRSPRTPLNQMLNITNTCLYQECTNITNIPSQDMCLNHVPNLYHNKPVPNTMYQNVPNHASIMYQNLYHTMYQTCTKSCINQNLCHTMCQHHIMHQYVSHHASMSPRNASYIYQKCISNNVPNIQDAPQTMCLNHIPYHS
jgi:hypothetical protein